MKKILLFAFILLLLGCDNTPKATNISSTDSVANELITIDYSNLLIDSGSELLLSEIADSISYIPLASDVLLKEVKYVTPSDTKEILVQSNNTLYKYDNSGKYIGRVFSTGRGPNEAIAVLQPMVNRKKREVMVSDYASNSYKIFGIDDGKLIRQLPITTDDWKSTVRISDYSGDMISYIQINRSFESTPESCNPYNKHLLEVKNIATDNMVYQHPNPDSSFRYKITDRMMTQKNNELLVGDVSGKRWFNIVDMDTIYTTTDFKDVVPVFVLKQPKASLDFRSSTMGYYGALDKSKIEYSRIENIVLTDRFVIVYRESFADGMTVYYDVKSSKIAGFARKIKNDIDGVSDLDLRQMLMRGSVNDNKIYFALDATKIMDNNKGDRFKGLNEYSNPIVMVIHLKK